MYTLLIKGTCYVTPKVVPPSVLPKVVRPYVSMLAILFSKMFENYLTVPVM